MAQLTASQRPAQSDKFIAQPRASQPAQTQHELTLLDLLRIHKKACQQLEHELISGQLAEIDDDRVASDHSSITGQWLLGPGHERFGHLPGWLAACRAHTRYHQCAMELLLARRNQADQWLRTHLEHQFMAASSRCQLELVRLFGKPH